MQQHIETTLVFKHLVFFPSMNKMLREHFTVRKQVKTNLSWLIKEQKPPKFPGRVKVEFTRYAVALQDWDNHCSSFKSCGDALKDCGIIIDDKPGIITEFIPIQHKVNKKTDERIEVRITSIS